MRIPVKRLIVVVILLFLSSLLISLKLEGRIGVLNKYIFFIFTPYDSILSYTKDIYSELPDKVKASIYNAKLRDEIVRLKLENENLKKNVKFETINIKKSKILYRDMHSFTRYIYIEGGIDRGFKKADAVCVIENDTPYLIGVIDSVYDKYSRIEIITSNNLRVIADVNGDTGLVTGGGTIKLDFIEPDVYIVTGTVVYTSRFSEILPSGIVIGYVKNVKNDFTKPFLTIELKSPVKLSGVSDVYIVRKQ